MNTTPQRAWASPAVDIFENDEAFLFLADLPGVKKEDLKLAYENGTLRLSAQRADHNFKRTFEIATRVEAEKIEAELRDGQLTVRLPKAQSERPREIPVN